MNYKRLITLLLSSNLLMGFVYSQMPGITYQALILQPEKQIPGFNNYNAPLINSDICLKFSLTSPNGTVEYQELVQLSTDQYGMINTIIGRGEVLYGFWSDVDWSSPAKFLKVEVDFEGSCYNFTILSYEELTAVPYALNSNSTTLPGPPGSSAYDLWLENGNEGTIDDFLFSLNGASGATGSSTFEVWQSLGNEGDEQDFINSFKGVDGATGSSTFEVWQTLGNEGDEQDFIDSLKGTNGATGSSTFEIWKSLGNEGNKQDFIDSFKGENGTSGNSAYDTWINLGNSGSEQDFLDSLKGEDANANLPDGNNNGDILNWVWNGSTWIKQIVNGNNSFIQLISSVNTTNQVICEDATISEIRYILSGTSTNVTVNGLPSGIISTISNDTLYIGGGSILDVSEQTRYNYTVTSLGGDGSQANGSITLNPSTTVTLTSGNLSQNSCLGQAISPVIFTVQGSGSNANATINGLPPGITSSINGNIVSISGIPSSSIVDGSIYSFSIQSNSESCDPDILQGQIVFSNCNSCEPNINVGSDTTICFGDSFSPASSASNYTSLLWSTSGSGSFNDINSPTPIYYPNSIDQTSGSVVLTLSAQNTNCVTPQTQISSITLSIVDCATVSATIINDNICTVFNNTIEFGAEINTPNIGAITAAGICYNTSGFPTVADTKVILNNTGSGDWVSTPPRFTASISNIPRNTVIYVRAFCETINGDIIYGDQIDVISTNSNLNHIFNFTNETGNFNIDDYPVSVTSEITFKRVKKLNELVWGTNQVERRGISKINFPVLDTVNGRLRIINEYSLENFFAPLLSKVGGDFAIQNTSLEKVILPEFKESARFYLDNNFNLDSVNLNKFKKTTAFSSQWDETRFRNNGNEYLVLPSLTKTNFLRIESNPNLRLVEMDSLILVEHAFFVSGNNSLLKLDLSQLFETGGNGRQFRSFDIYNNPNLNNINIPEIRKVYDGLFISNNSSLDVSQEFPCELYVFFNDTADCSPVGFTVNGNLNNTYCFQDLSLRGSPTLITQSPVLNPTREPGTLEYTVLVDLTQGSNSYVQYEELGVVFSTSPNPLYDGDFDRPDAVDPYYAICCDGDFLQYSTNVGTDGVVLNPSTTYYVKSYAKACNGTIYYGNEMVFSTP